MLIQEYAESRQSIRLGASVDASSNFNSKINFKKEREGGSQGKVLLKSNQGNNNRL